MLLFLAYQSQKLTFPSPSAQLPPTKNHIILLCGINVQCACEKINSIVSRNHLILGGSENLQSLTEVTLW